MFSEVQYKLDTAVAAATVSAPWWLWVFDHGTHVLLVLGGLVLLALRIMIAWREWRERRQP